MYEITPDGNLVLNGVTLTKFDENEEEIFHDISENFVVSNFSLYSFENQKIFPLFNINSKLVIDAKIQEPDDELNVSFIDDSKQTFVLPKFSPTELPIKNSSENSLNSQKSHVQHISKSSLLHRKPKITNKNQDKTSKNLKSSSSQFSNSTLSNSKFSSSQFPKSKFLPKIPSRSSSSGYANITDQKLFKQKSTSKVSLSVAKRTTVYQNFPWALRPFTTGELVQELKTDLKQYATVRDFTIQNEKVFLDLGKDGLKIKACTDEEKRVFSPLNLAVDESKDSSFEAKTGVSESHGSVLLRNRYLFACRNNSIQYFDIKSCKSSSALKPSKTLKKNWYTSVEKLGNSFATATTAENSLLLLNEEARILHKHQENDKFKFQRINFVCNDATSSVFGSSDKFLNWIDWNQPDSCQVLMKQKMEINYYHAVKEGFSNPGEIVCFYGSGIDKLDLRRGSIVNRIGVSHSKFSPKGDARGNLVVTHSEGKILVFDVRNLEEPCYSIKNLSPVSRVLFSPHSSHVYCLTSESCFYKYALF